MTRPPAASPFLARRAYRRRRLIDAARLLPVVGTILFLLPLLWAAPLTRLVATAPMAFYLFLAWSGLILAAGLISWRIGRGDPGEAPRDGGEGE